MAKGQRALLSCHLHSPALSFMWDHRVSGRPLLPGAAFFEAAVAAAATLLSGSSTFWAADVALSGVSIPAPLVLPPASQAGADVELQVAVGLTTGQLEVLSGQPSKPTRHLTAAASMVSAQEGSSTAQPATPAARALQGLLQRSAGSQQGTRPASFAALSAPSHDTSGLRVSPAVLDSCLQLGAVKGRPLPAELLRVPTGVGALLMPGASSGRVPASATSCPQVAQQQPGAANSTYTNYALVSGAGLSMCQIGSLEAKPMAAPKAAESAAPAVTCLAVEQWLYEAAWLTHGVDAGSAAQAAAAAAQSGRRLELGGQQALAAAGAVAVAQVAIAQGLQSLTLVSHGLQLGAGQQLVPAAAHSSSGAGVWAVMRTVAQELSAFSVAAMDTPALGPAVGAAAAHLLAAPAGSKPSGFPEASPYGLAVAGGALAAASLLPSRVAPSLPAFQLMPEPRGALQNLVPRAVPAAEVAPGKVLVAVKAVGINFR